MTTLQKSQDQQLPQVSPTAWFAVLEAARNTHDYELAAQALSELKRLGVDVRFRRRAASKEGGQHD